MDDTNFEPILQNYLNHCRYEKRLDAKTLKAYKTDIEQFSYYVTKNNGNYGKECIQAYIASLHSKYAVKSVKRKIASLKAFFNYLEFEEIVILNPSSKMRLKLHEPFLPPRTIPLTTISTLLNCAYAQLSQTHPNIYSYAENLRNVAALELLFAPCMANDGTAIVHSRFQRIISAENTVLVYKINQSVNIQ